MFEQDRFTSNAWSPCRGQKLSVTFIFIPGLSGVSGSERGDRPVCLASTGDRQPMDNVGVVNVLREFGREEDFEQGDLTSVWDVRVEVKNSIAKTYRIVDQHRTRSL